MRKLWVILAIFGVISDVCYAQNERLGWFVTDKPSNELIFQRDLQNSKVLGLEQVIKPETKGNFKNMRRLKKAADDLKSTFHLPLKENIVISPLAIQITSLIMAEGVVDASLFEFSKIVPFLRLAHTTEIWGKYVQKKKEGMRIKTALWGDIFNGYYEQSMKKKFDVETWSLQGKVEVINSWINEILAEKFEAEIDYREIQERVFVSSVAVFEDGLISSFDEKNTKRKIFHNIDGTDGVVFMMQQKIEADYYEDDVVRAVRLETRNKHNITIVMPRENISFYKFVTNLDPRRLKPSFDKNVWVNLSLPKIELSYQLKDMKKYYEKLGVRSIFKPSHNFAKMINYDALTNIEDVLLINKFVLADEKKSVIEKDETKVEKMFVANRPFIFVVNNGDFIGIFGLADDKNVEDVLEDKINKPVVVRERKDGEPAWFEGKSGTSSVNRN